MRPGRSSWKFVDGSITGIGFVPVKPVITSMISNAGLTPNFSLPL